jgi:hypothetical protein
MHLLLYFFARLRVIGPVGMVGRVDDAHMITSAYKLILCFRNFVLHIYNNQNRIGNIQKTYTLKQLCRQMSKKKHINHQISWNTAR